MLLYVFICLSAFLLIDLANKLNKTHSDKQITTSAFVQPTFFQQLFKIKPQKCSYYYYSY